MGVVGRAEHALERFARAPGVGRLEVEVVVAADAPPRQADAPDDAVEAAVHRQVVEQEIAGRDAEGGGAADKAGDDVVAHILHLGRRFRLRIGQEHHLETLQLLGADQGEIDVGGQRSGRPQPGIAQAERVRRALRLVHVGEQRQMSGQVRRHGEAGWLDQEDRHARRDRQGVAPHRVRADDVAAVGDQHVGDRQVGDAVPTGTRDVLAHRAGNGRGVCRLGRRRLGGRGAGRGGLGLRAGARGQRDGHAGDHEAAPRRFEIWWHAWLPAPLVVYPDRPA